MCVTDETILRAFEALCAAQRRADGSLPDDSEGPRFSEVAAQLGVTVDRVRDVVIDFWTARG